MGRESCWRTLEAEVAAFLASSADKLTSNGRQRLVRHEHWPEREIMTGIGPVAVRCPPVRDRVGEGSESSIDSFNVQPTSNFMRRRWS